MAFYGTFTDGRLSAVLRNGESIGCCCGGCCMYSAAGLSGGDFTTADLPVAINVISAAFTGEMTQDEEGQSYSSANNAFTMLLDLVQWVLVKNDDQTQSLRRDCLITGDGNLTPGDDLVEDRLNPTYSITGTLTGTVTRVSTCNWSVTNIILKFNSTTQKWNVNGNEKSSGNQSSPVGSYTGGFTVA